jgi:hypothetical protein
MEMQHTNLAMASVQQISMATLEQYGIICTKSEQSNKQGIAMEMKISSQKCMLPRAWETGAEA